MICWALISDFVKMKALEFISGNIIGNFVVQCEKKHRVVGKSQRNV